MTITVLQLYNESLRLCGERALSSTSEAREPRRLLDDVYNGGAVDYCLEQGLWKFAIRTSQVDYDATITPDFGYPYAFAHPSDWKRTVEVSGDEFFNGPLTDYRDEAGYWFANLTTIFVRYVSNDVSYGANLALWPETFRRFLCAYMAGEIIDKLSQAQTRRVEILRQLRERRADALAKDAMNDPTKFYPQGSWSGARMGVGWRTSSRWSGGWR